MITAGITTPLCAHCGRPVTMTAVLHGGRAYHYECTQSPYQNKEHAPQAPNIPSAPTDTE